MFYSEDAELSQLVLKNGRKNVYTQAETGTTDIKRMENVCLVFFLKKRDEQNPRSHWCFHSSFWFEMCMLTNIDRSVQEHMNN